MIFNTKHIPNPSQRWKKNLLFLFFGFMILSFGVTEFVTHAEEPDALKMLRAKGLTPRSEDPNSPVYEAVTKKPAAEAPTTKATPPPLIGNIDAFDGGFLLPGPGTALESKKYANEKFLPGLTNIIFITLLSISVAAIIVAGFFYVSSNGDSEKTKRAKDIIFWTIVGVGLAAFSYAIISMLLNTNFLA